MPYMPMYKEYNIGQDFLLPPNLTDSFPEDDLVRLMPDLIRKLDLRPLHRKHSLLGKNAYHPAMRLSVLICAYSQKIFSSRAIAEHLK